MGISAWGQVFIGPTAPAESPVQIGSLWIDTTANLLKRCTSILPYTWISVEGGGGGTLPTPIAVTLMEDAVTLTNFPAAKATWSESRTKLDLTNATNVRVICMRTSGAGATNGEIRVEYSTDEATWIDLAVVNINALGCQVGAWTAVPAGAKADIFVQTYRINGDGVADPVIGLVTLQIK